MKIIFKSLIIGMFIVCTSFVDIDETQDAKLKQIEQNLAEAQLNLDAITKIINDGNK